MAYLVSFGDTMTALLAFFIVLNSLAKDQTGANLHAGTGSFVSAVRGLGVPGWFKETRSKTPVPAEHAKPIYYVDDDGNAVDKGAGPDEDDNGLSVLDRQREQVQRVVNELEQLFKLDRSAESIDDVVFDIFEMPGKKPNILGKDALKVLLKCIPLTKLAGYDVQVIVWTPTPGIPAWTRKTLLASEIRDEIARKFSLTQVQKSRLNCLARAWFSKDDKRPTISVRVSKSTQQQ